jgi:hypothetical protein
MHTFREGVLRAVTLVNTVKVIYAELCWVQDGTRSWWLAMSTLTLCTYLKPQRKYQSLGRNHQLYLLRINLEKYMTIKKHEIVSHFIFYKVQILSLSSYFSRLPWLYGSCL